VDTPAVRTRTAGGPGRRVSPDQARAFVLESLRTIDLDGADVCVLVPDATRSCPLPLVLRAVHEGLHDRVARLTVFVALGTHRPMTEDELATHLGYPAGRPELVYPGTTIRNHEWSNPATFVTIGSLGEHEVAAISGGLLRERLDVRINRHVAHSDVALVVGPVFPHEVVGFSGGNKYLFPGVSAPEVINLSHWLGALITSAGIIGTRGITPVRRLIDRAASLVPSRRLCLAMVVGSGTDQITALAFGTPEQAWAAAADVSAQVHIRRLDRPVRRALSLVPRRYEDLWTAAKGMYKVEPVLADGGEIVLYAPHLTEVSRVHGDLIAEVGYHCRDYFLAHWDRFRHLPWGVLAHSTHLRGTGTYDPLAGERCRVTVTLATGIQESTCRALGLAYRDPAAIDPDAWARDPDTLVVPDAGEVLHRLR
jgi:nickel-dependent lactate racemase